MHKHSHKNGKTITLIIATLAINLLYQVYTYANTGIDPRERIFFWKNNYTELSSDTDSRVIIAQDIFSKLVKISGRWQSQEPKLFIIKENPYNITLPIALPDGWIVLSKKVLDICFGEKQFALDRLAFVLAHELSHHRSDDFWHIKFFQALQSPTHKSIQDQNVINSLKSLARHSDEILATELRADELAIVYMLMAGFDTDAIVNNNSTNSFFTDWVTAVNPERYSEDYKSSTHPNAAQRATAVRTRLAQVVDKSRLFELGLWFYQAGDYDNAILAFEDFRQYYPGREVIHNLATSYHQLAIRYYQPDAQDKNKVPFQYAITIDQVNRARNNIYRSHTENRARFEYYLDNAIKYYLQAINLDSEYLPAYNNLSSAYLLQNRPYKAIAILQDAEQFAAEDPFLLNNLAISLYMADNKNKAEKYFRKATQNNNPLPFYNYSVYALREGNTGLANKYRKLYVSKDANSHWARQLNVALNKHSKQPQTSDLPSRQREKLADVEIGTYLFEVPARWGKPVMSATYTLNTTKHLLTRYSNGIISISEGDEIRILVAGTEYHGRSLKNIGIGQSEREIINRYGRAATVYWTTQGKRLAYHNLGITFYLTDERVSGWQLYWE